MDKQQEMLNYARKYLHGSHVELYENKQPPEAFSLNRQLQYHLCTAYQRMMDEFGEVTRKDIILLIESWRGYYQFTKDKMPVLAKSSGYVPSEIYDCHFGDDKLCECGHTYVSHFTNDKKKESLKGCFYAYNCECKKFYLDYEKLN